MTIETLTSFLMWCMIINVGMLTLMFLICTCGLNWAYKIHSRWFPLPRDTFNAMIYGFIGGYKLLIFFFNVIPYVALRIAAG
jgi:hypothetical protein